MVPLDANGMRLFPKTMPELAELLQITEQVFAVDHLAGLNHRVTLVPIGRCQTRGPRLHQLAWYRKYGIFHRQSLQFAPLLFILAAHFVRVEASMGLFGTLTAGATAKVCALPSTSSCRCRRWFNTRTVCAHAISYCEHQLLELLLEWIRNHGNR